MGGKFYALCLFLACLAALIAGYALGGQITDNKPRESLKTPPEVRYYETVEAQGAALPEPHFETYEEYEAHVMDYVNDRRMYDNRNDSR